MKKLLFVLLVVAAFIPAVIGQTSAVKAFAAFDNVKSTGSGEHGYGYKVELWKSGNSLVGFVYVQNGLMGDPPVGMLENVKYDAAKKKLSFTAKLTLGNYSDKTHDSVPSQDTLKFDGSVTTSRLSGIIKTTNDLCANKCPEKATVSLRPWKGGLEFMKNYKDVDEWKRDNKQLLESLGPKW